MTESITRLFYLDKVKWHATKLFGDSCQQTLAKNHLVPQDRTRSSLLHLQHERSDYGDRKLLMPSIPLGKDINKIRLREIKLTANNGCQYCKNAAMAS